MPPRAGMSTRQRRSSVKTTKYIEDDVSDGEREEMADKRKRARQLDYQSRQDTSYPLLDQIVGRRINKITGLAEYLCKFSGRSYLHLWWLIFEEVELFFSEGYQNYHRIQNFDRKMRREGYTDLEDADELESGKITVEKILNHKVDPMDQLDEAIENRRTQLVSLQQLPRVTDAFLVDCMEGLQERMTGLVKKLLNEHGAEVFRHPVDINEIPDYLNIIHNPMDLGTIGTRLARESYYIGPSAVSLFASEMRLVFINCQQYNAEGSDIWKISGKLLHLFDKWLYDWIYCPSAWLKLEQEILQKEFVSEAEDIYDLWSPWVSGCVICRSSGDSEQLLLCDRCDGEIHMFCVTPEITELPEGDWLCAFCEVRTRFEHAAPQITAEKKRKTTKTVAGEGTLINGQNKLGFPIILSKKSEYPRKHNAKSISIGKSALPQTEVSRKALTSDQTSHKATFFLVKWLGLSIRFSTWERPEDINDDEQIQRYFKFSRVPTSKEIEKSTCQLPCCAKRNRDTLHSLPQNCCEKDRFCTLGRQHTGNCSRELNKRRGSLASEPYGSKEYQKLCMAEQIKAQLFAFHCLLNNHTPNKEVLKQCGVFTYAFICKKQYLIAPKAAPEEGDEDFALDDDEMSDSCSDDEEEVDESMDEELQAFKITGPSPIYPGVLAADTGISEEPEMKKRQRPEDDVTETLACMVEHVALGYPAVLEKTQRRTRMNSIFPTIAFKNVHSFTEYGVTLRRSPFGLGMRLGVSDNGSTCVLGFQLLTNGMIGPAQAAQVISVGDALAAVNGIAVAGMGFKDIIQLISRSQELVTLHFHSQKRPALMFPPYCQARHVVCVDEAPSIEHAITSSVYADYSFDEYKSVLKVGISQASTSQTLTTHAASQYMTLTGPMQHLYAAVVDNSIDPHEHFASFLPSKPRSRLSKDNVKDDVKSDKADFIPYEQSPTFKGGRTLRSYQVEGLNWMISCWKAQRSCILADEMGLGKTVQVVSLIEHLKSEESIRGPYLIVVPLSTIQHWRREIESWTDLNVCVYHDIGDRQNRGFNSKDMRAMIRAHEWYFPGLGNHSIFRFHVLLTTFETIHADFDELEPIHWRLLVVDEAHRLKSASSRVLKQIRVLHCDRKLLLTGTPLQNNMQELWVLLNFLEPVKFDNYEDFDAKFGTLHSQEQVITLQKLLAPFVLRRVKEDVEKSIPPKEETIIAVELTTLQKQYYRAIYDKNRSFLYRGIRNGLPRLINIQLQLRKCCNHPFLIKGVEERELKDLGTEPTMSQIMEKTIQCSGKFVLVSKLLPKLKREGHKVLIFSQFLKQLDLLERYCEFHSFGYERLDGGTNGAARQAAIDRFSRPNAKSFIFLLSTKAGGVGINLIAADTVVIFDSDWNPQNDLQAQSRCHRIGQKKSVQIYRLITRNTYESEMFNRASQKLGLEHAVLGRGSFNEMNRGEKPSADQLVELLKRGAYALMEDDDDASKQFQERDIETILRENARVRIMNTNGAEEDANTRKPLTVKSRMRKSLAGMSIDHSSFIADGSTNELSVDDPNFWEKVLSGSVSVEMLSIKLEDGSALANPESTAKFIANLGIALDELVIEMKRDSVENESEAQRSIVRTNLEHEYDFAIQVLHRISTKLRKHFLPEQLQFVKGYLNRLEKSRVRTCRVSLIRKEPLATPSPEKKRRRVGSIVVVESPEKKHGALTLKKRKKPRQTRKKEEIKTVEKKQKTESLSVTNEGFIADSDDLCTLCGDGGLILLCDGPCHRSFHLECIGMKEEPQDERWLCPDCAAGKHMCLLCNQVGDMGVEFGVMQCSMARCGRFYHRGCLESNAFVEWVGNKRFRCPSHSCHACKRTNDSKKKNFRRSNNDILSCIHCAEAYHNKCSPPTKIVRLSKSLMICAAHLVNGKRSSNTYKAEIIKRNRTNNKKISIEPVVETSTENDVKESTLVAKSNGIVESETNVQERKCAFCHQMEPSEELGDFIDTPVRLQARDKSVEYVFAHKNCALQSAEVYVNKNGAYCNITRAIKRGRQLKCTACHDTGATVNCMVENCRTNFHLHCANKNGEFVDSEFSFYCKTHAENKKSEIKGVCVCDTKVEQHEKSLQCATCATRYHAKCLNMSERQVSRRVKEEWNCAKCEDAQTNVALKNKSRGAAKNVTLESKKPAKVEEKPVAIEPIVAEIASEPPSFLRRSRRSARKKIE